MSNALLITYNRFPNGDAGAVRQEAFAKLLQLVGYEVNVICMGAYTEFDSKEYEGIPYVSFRNKSSSLYSKINNVIFFKRKLKRYLNVNRNISLILVVEIPILALFFLKKYSKLHNITLIHDCVEWYSSEQFALGRFSWTYIKKELYNRTLIDQDFKVVAISRFLYDHFISKNIQTTKVPVIMDSSKINNVKRINEDFVTFVYAGSPGKKDYLLEIIESFGLLPKSELSRIKFFVVGPSMEQIIRMGISEKLIDQLESTLIIVGRVPREEVLRILSMADYTILLRPDGLRYAKAGFPSKVVESLMTGTPVICNISSDLGDYIIDLYNGIIVEGNSSTNLAKSLQKAIELNYSERKEMQRNARISAESNFDYKIYAHQIELLIKERHDE